MYPIVKQILIGNIIIRHRDLTKNKHCFVIFMAVLAVLE